MSQDKASSKVSRATLTRRTVLSGAAAMGLSTVARAQQPAEVKVGLIVPLSGIYTRPGQVMRMGAEMGIEHINAQGGIKSLGGAKLKLVVIDCGDTTEKAKNAAQRMVAQETDLVAATGSYLSSFTLAVTEVTERAELPMLTLSYSDLLTERGFKYIFQTAAPASRQSELGLPELMKLAESRIRQTPEDGGDADGQHGDIGRDRQGAQGKTLRAGRPSTGRGGSLDTAALRRHAADPEGQVGPSGSAAVHAQRDLGRQTRSGKDQRVRARPGQDSNGLLQHHDCGARHAAERQPRRRPGHRDDRRQLGLEGPRGSDRRAESKIQGALDDAERHLDLWRHVADEGGAGKAGKADRRAVAEACSDAGWRTVETLSRRPAEVRRKGSPRRRRRCDRAVAIRRARHRHFRPISALAAPFWPKKS